MAPSQLTKLRQTPARPISRRPIVRRPPANEERLAAAQWRALNILLIATVLYVILARLQGH